MKTVYFVLVVFLTSFICAYTASYAADEAILKETPAPGNRTVLNYNGLNYHNRSVSLQVDQQPDMKKIQTRLKELGYKCGPIDGVVGPKTEQAIRAFQKDKKLVADGVVGPATRQALNLKN